NSESRYLQALPMKVICARGEALNGSCASPKLGMQNSKKHMPHILFGLGKARSTRLSMNEPTLTGGPCQFPLVEVDRPRCGWSARQPVTQELPLATPRGIHGTCAGLCGRVEPSLGAQKRIHITANSLPPTLGFSTENLFRNQTPGENRHDERPVRHPPRRRPRRDDEPRPVVGLAAIR